MRKAVNATTERLFSEQLDHRGESRAGRWAGRCRTADAERVTTNQQADIVVLRSRLVSKRHYELVRRDAVGSLWKRAGYHCKPSGGNQPDPAA